MSKSIFKTIILFTLITLISACRPGPTQEPANATSSSVSSTQTPSPPLDTTTPLTAERLIEECAEAMGGIDKIDSLETMRVTQRFPDHAGLIHYEIKRPNLVRLGDNLVFDGERGSWLEGKNPEGTLLVSEEEWKDFEVDIAWYVPAFFDYPAEYVGTETLDNIETYKLQVQLPLGASMTYYLDAQTYLVHKATAYFTIGDAEFQPERVYSDYQLRDGILYPHAFTYQGRDGVFTATMINLEFNIPLEDDRFSLPKEVYDVLPTGTNVPVPGVVSVDTVDQLELLNTLTGHSDKVYTLVFSGDSLYLASVSQDNLVKVWDVVNGGEVFSFEIREVGMNDIALSPDGHLLASSENIWDVESKQIIHELDPGVFGPVAFSPDSSILAVSPFNQPIKLVDVASGQVMRTLDNQAGNFTLSIEFSPDGTLMAAGGHLNGLVTLWDVENGQIVRTFAHDTKSNFHGVAFSPDGQLLASAATQGTTKLWNVASGELVHVIPGTGCYDVTFSPDGSLLATAGCGPVKLWEVASWRQVLSLPYIDEVMTVVFSPDGTLLASGGYDQQIHLWGLP